MFRREQNIKYSILFNSLKYMTCFNPSIAMKHKRREDDRFFLNSKYFLYKIIVVVFTAVSILSASISLEEVSKKATSIDETICNILQNPQKEYRLKINKYIKSYVDEIEKVVVGLMRQNTEVGSEVKKLIEGGGAKFMNVTVNIDDLEDSFQWGEKQLTEFKELREKTRDVWMKLHIQYYESEEVQVIE